MYTMQIWNENKGWRKVATFESEIYAEIIDAARAIAVTPMYGADNVALVDEFDDEVVWDYCHECEEEKKASEWGTAYYDEPEYEEEIGFNPYEGCYDYDC